MSGLAGLIERVEKGERSLDLETAIHCAINPEWRPCSWPYYLATVERIDGGKTARGDYREIVPRYFSSLDAARSLVPDGMSYQVGFDTRDKHGAAWIYGGDLVQATTAEAALVLAALKARAPK